MQKILKTIVVKILTWEARLILAKYQPKVIGLTGSVGKTSTKDAVYTVVQHFVASARKSQKSYNSELGAPLTIIGVESPFGGWASVLGWVKNIFIGLWLIVWPVDYPDWLVLELGADRPGDIKNNLARWLPLEVAIITTLPTIPAHVEFFPSPEAVWEEKASLLAALEPAGVAILNADDERVLALAKQVKQRVLTYGLNRTADLVASHYHLTYRQGQLDGLAFKVDCAGNSLPLRFKNVAGEHHIYPGLVALAVALSQGWNMVEAAAALEKHEPTPGRTRLLPGRQNLIILDDTYNSSPVALSAALAVLAGAETAGRKIAILGDMLELGNFTASTHETAGQEVAGVVDELYLIGLRAKFIGQAATKAGLAKSKIHYFDRVEEAIDQLAERLPAGSLVLIKGSQALRLEKIVQALMAEPDRAGELLVRQNTGWLAR